MMCKICGTTNIRESFMAREMMFGIRSTFEYVACASCHCLQLKCIPSDLSYFYPAEYFGNANCNIYRHRLAKWLGSICLTFPGLIKFVGLPKWIRELRITRHSSILDVGCGDGTLLRNLYSLGFDDLTGIDKFINYETNVDNRLRIFRKDIAAMQRGYDVVILNHSLEHIDEHYLLFGHLSRLLNNQGILIVRTPIADSYAYRSYHENWVQLDPPRHVLIHSVASFKILSQRSGFKITKILYDSTPLQFWGSEQYARDISLFDKRSLYNGFRNSIFSKEQLKQFSRHAKCLNKQKDGDQVTFIVTKA